jgi:hypothetical protein
LSRNLGTLTSWNPLGHSRPVTGLLYLFFTLHKGDNDDDDDDDNDDNNNNNNNAE